MENEIWCESDLQSLLAKVRGVDIARLATDGCISQALILTKLLLKFGDYRGVREANRAFYRIRAARVSGKRKRRQ